MKRLILRILGTSLSFYATAYLVAGFQIEPTWTSYLIASFIFLLINWFIAPIVKLLLLPLNLITLGLFRWFANVLVLYIFDILYQGIEVTSYHFAGWSSPLLALPPGNISLFWAYVLSSLVIAITSSFFFSLLDPES